MSYQKVTAFGNLGRDVELRYTPQGTAVANFTLATAERRKDKAGDFQEITTWFRVTLWGKMAENAAKYLKKGSPVYVEGPLSLEEWQDREGANRFTLGITAREMQFLSGGQQGTGGSGSKQSADADEEFSGESTEDAPHPPPQKTKAANAGAGKKAAAPVPPEDDIPF